jgi:hypothetical protein
MSNPQVAALFIDPKGPYVEMPNVDVWDELRDARKYAGPYPVVAHPPCSNWSNMAPVVQSRRGHRIGDDGGCFAAAVRAVRKFGGVLEQPAYSRAWNASGLARPGRGAWSYVGDGYVCQVSQSAYGHRARKRTWLYYVGRLPPPELDWSDPKGEAVVSFCRRRGDGSVWNDPRPRLSKREASRTPTRFAEVLIHMATRSQWEATG